MNRIELYQAKVKNIKSAKLQSSAGDIVSRQITVIGLIVLTLVLSRLKSTCIPNDQTYLMGRSS